MYLGIGWTKAATYSGLGGSGGVDMGEIQVRNVGSFLEPLLVDWRV